MAASSGRANSSLQWGFLFAIAGLLTLTAFHHGSGGIDWAYDHSSRESVRRLAFGNNNHADAYESEVVFATRATATRAHGANRKAHLPEPLWEDSNGGDVWAPWKTVQAAQAHSVPVFVSAGYNKGRSGHELKDVATPFILGVMYGWEPCFAWWWTSKPVKMFNPAFGLRDCETYSAKDLVKKGKAKMEERLGPGVTKVVYISHRMTSYDGMEFEQVEALAAKVRAAQATAEPGTVIRVGLSKSTRVHMHQVYNWRLEGKIPHAVFEPVRRTLQARFFHRLSRVSHTIRNVEEVPYIDYLAGPPSCKNNADPDSQCVYFSPTEEAKTKFPLTPAAHPAEQSTNVVAAHFRRGDVAHLKDGKYTSKMFAQRMVNQLHTLLDPCAGDLVITLHTERQGADDLKKNGGVANITKIYSTESWEHDMSAFVNADILVVTNSSMSTWASIFATGLTIMPSGLYVKHFGFRPPPTNLIPFTDRLEFPTPWLQSRGCIGGNTGGARSSSSSSSSSSLESEHHFGVWQ